MAEVEPVSEGVGVVQLGEGPCWDAARDVLWWVDVLGHRLYCYEPSSGGTANWVLDGPVSCVTMRSDGSLLVGLRDGLGAFDPATGLVRTLVEVEQGVPTNRFNDGNVDAAGRFWAGTMDRDGAPGAGTLYRIDPDLTCLPVVADVSISNGIDWSPDGRLMYYVDTLTQRVDVFDFDVEHGTIHHRRCLVEVPREDGTPDGLTVDAEGHIWVAMFGGWSVNRFTPDGNPAGRVAVPVSNVSSCCFGGAEYRDLYITTATVGLTHAQRREQPTAGQVFRTRPGVAGRQQHTFGG